MYFLPAIDLKSVEWVNFTCPTTSIEVKAAHVHNRTEDGSIIVAKCCHCNNQHVIPAEGCQVFDKYADANPSVYTEERLVAA